MRKTRTSRVIKASREALYQAFTDPEALAAWMAPEGMTGKVHEFDGRVGGGYSMSLFYPSYEQEHRLGLDRAASSKWLSPNSCHKYPSRTASAYPSRTISFGATA